jgi:hypothetical protein
MINCQNTISSTSIASSPPEQRYQRLRHAPTIQARDLRIRRGPPTEGLRTFGMPGRPPSLPDTMIGLSCSVQRSRLGVRAVRVPDARLGSLRTSDLPGMVSSRCPELSRTTLTQPESSLDTRAGSGREPNSRHQAGSRRKTPIIRRSPTSVGGKPDRDSVRRPACLASGAISHPCTTGSLKGSTRRR